MMKHFSFRSCMDWDKLFKSMFPDRKIARQFKRSKTKCSYYINFGIAPVFNKNLTKEISIPLCWNRTHSDLTCFFHQININLKTKKKIKKSDFYKNKKVFKIDEIDADKILVSKIEPYVQISQLNISLDIMMMMLLDHYVWNFLKWLDMLNALIVIRQCLSRLLIKSC